MRQRCNYTAYHAYHRYGGRGIKVCVRWNVFAHFLLDVGPKPSKSHALERVDNDGNYEPGNVVWATRKVQARNRCCNRFVEFNGTSKTIAEWAAITGLPSRVIERRLNKLGYSIERTLTQPLRVWPNGHPRSAANRHAGAAAE